MPRRDRPRILHLIDSGGPGGAETVCLNLITGLDPAGWDHHVVVPVRDWLHAALADRGIPSTVIGSEGSFDFRYLAEIVRLIRERRIDLVQTHLFTTAVYASVAGRISGVPVVSTIHGIVDTGPPNRKRDFKFRLLDSERNRIVLVSSLLKESIATQGHLRDEITRVVPNGIDVSEFRPAPDTSFRRELGIPSDGVLIGALGNVRVPKDYANLLEAAAILKSLSPAYRIVIIGDTDGMPELYRQLVEKHAELGLGDVVRFAGFRSDTPRLLNNLDIFVMSSEKEGLPLAMLQAMATGVPVVATRCGGPQEVIVEGENGLLVDTHAPADLANALHTLAADPFMADKFRAAGRRTIEERFTIDRMIEGYTSIYQESLG